MSDSKVSIELGTQESPVYLEYVSIHNQCHEHHNYLLGRILTILDASITDERQVKAAKDLAKGEFTDVWHNMLRESILTGFRHVAKATNDPWSKEWDQSPLP